MSATPSDVAASAGPTRLQRVLDWIERVGNKLPDPALLFVLLMGVVAVLSWALSGVTWEVIDPRSKAPLVINNLLDGESITAFFSAMVNTFVTFAPLGVVLVSMLGLGIAEHTGFINAVLRALMQVTVKSMLTPMVAFVAILSHYAVDAGYVLVIPLAGVIFYAAGRHPLAGIAAAFAAVSGAYSATFIVPTSLDPMLSNITMAAAQILDPAHQVSPVNNLWFTASSSILVVVVVWVLTDRVIEPRLVRSTAVDGDTSQMPTFEPLKPVERRAMWLALGAMVLAAAVFTLAALPGDSVWRGTDGSLTANDAALMKSIVPLIFILFLVPGVTYGIAAGTVKTHKDVIAGMSKAMSGMGYYLVLVFFCAQFIWLFSRSNLGVLLAVEGAEFLKAASLPVPVTLLGITLLTTTVNILIGSASAKWTLLAPIFVPMLMQLGISPDLTQAAYRIGDSSTNIITPLMPYFPLVVVFCQKYVRNTGIGTVVALMIPFSISFLVLWSLFLAGYMALELPLGPGSSYVYPPVSP
ncbi:MAG: AbgT family transporter [Xanthomonadaceae bacterium]|jgi:aminobenzoyl-glutamate transport protein|nr:AbgT family transporter [Xanthomonadaceae bacterium]